MSTEAIQEQREITVKVKELELTIERLQATADMLASRIQPVLQDVPAPTGALPEDAPAATPLGRALQSFNNKLVNLDNQLRDLEGRVEL